MQETHRDPWQDGRQLFVRGGGIGQVKCFALFNEGADPIHLPAFGQLRPNAANHFIASAVRDHLGHHRCAAWRQLINDRDLQVSVVTHGQGARNRRGRHHQQVGLHALFLHLVAQGQALRHAKAMLLIDHRQGQVFEFHLLLNDSMGTDHQGGLA